MIPDMFLREGKKLGGGGTVMKGRILIELLVLEFSPIMAFFHHTPHAPRPLSLHNRKTFLLFVGLEL